MPLGKVLGTGVASSSAAPVSALGLCCPGETGGFVLSSKKGIEEPQDGSSVTFGDAVLRVPYAKTMDCGRGCPLSEKRIEDLTSWTIHGFCRHEI